MSYSRWGGRGSGHWYTFWHYQEDSIENKDNALFDICTVICFTAKELRDNIEECLSQVQSIDNEGDIDELRQ